MAEPAVSHLGWSGLAGIREVDITPPVGIYARCWGAAVHEVAEGIHRPLTATALVLRDADDGTPPFVLVGMDLPWWKDADDEWFVRGGLIDHLSLDPDRVMINLAHTHAAGSVARMDADLPGGEHIVPYLERIQERVTGAVRGALEGLQPATLEWATGHCSLASNRDLPDPDGHRYLCGYHPGAEADGTLLVGRLSGADALLGTVVNYACHPTTFAWENRLISPDFVGPMRESVATASGAPCLFLQGASGELAPRRQYTADPAIVEANGRELGYAVLATLEGMLPPGTGLEMVGVVESGASLAVWDSVPSQQPRDSAARRTSVDLPLRADTPEEDGTVADADRVMAERLRRRRVARSILGEESPARMQVWVWRLGAVLIVGQPAEAYSLLQIELRRRFPDHAVIVTNLSNGPHFSYLPPRDLYGRDLYQVWQTPIEAGGLERTIEAITASIERLLPAG